MRGNRVCSGVKTPDEYAQCCHDSSRHKALKVYRAFCFSCSRKSPVPNGGDMSIVRYSSQARRQQAQPEWRWGVSGENIALALIKSSMSGEKTAIALIKSSISGWTSPAQQCAEFAHQHLGGPSDFPFSGPRTPCCLQSLSGAPSVLRLSSLKVSWSVRGNVAWPWWLLRLV